MTRTILNLFTALAISLPTAALASNWNFDTEHTQIGFKVQHMMVMSVTGLFDESSGKAEINDKDFTKSKFNVTINTASVNTRHIKRDAHLKSPEFLDAATHPQITFVSKKIKKNGKNNWKMTGDLTIRGISKEVTVDAETTAIVTGPWGKTRRGISGSSKINRNDFKVSWNKKFDKGVVVGDMVELWFNVEMIKSTDAKQARK